ncbi:hypothetical protein ASG49_07970 [Marmoricola sp. Leaf446]|uniref:hypothetical protein n=1 Tax=Marmoricola sp. Leaf446 TaxID=1736379 RepID=UPI0006F2FBC8|nr:hypothetical protein [Marmoricola sp. Leaf446]KQT94746.1 hypothetical protein ASG49_07970 [Marmoricola sp. Leaf446]
MLKLDNVRIINEHQVHGDDTSPATFYILPRFPRLARLENGGLGLRFVEYSALREEGGNVFGGFVAFDVDLAIPQPTLDAVTAALDDELARQFPGGQPPKAQLAPVPWLGGAVKLLLSQNDTVVEKVSGAATPSLAGNNVACFLMELSQLGTTIFKDTLSTGTSSGIQVVYDLDYYCRLPEMHATGTWNASEFYSFFQDVNTEDNFWSEDSYTEVVSSSRYKSDVTKTEFSFVADPNIPPEQQADFETTIRNTINTQLAEAVKRNLMQAITDVDPNVKNLNEDQDIEDIRRSVNKTQIANVSVEWREAKAVVMDVHPQGSLPTVTSLKDADGNALKWEDYYSKISVDEFLKSILVNVRVNADFDDLPIHSVEVKCRYDHGPGAKSVEKTFTQADEVQKIEFLAHQGNRKYVRSYQVNFDNSAFVLQSPEEEVDDNELTINVDDLGVLGLDVVNGDINFEQVARAHVRVRYAGDGAAPIEKFLNLTATEGEFKIRDVIQGRRTAPVTYQTTYTMKGDGREITVPEETQDAKVIAINDPFRGLRTITFRALGDLANAISSISIQATWNEPTNAYRQETAVALSSAMPFSEWKFPTIDERDGTLAYTATITKSDGSSKSVEESDVRGTLITVGELVEAFLEVDVVPDLVDWTQVKLVNVSLRYDDNAGDVHEAEELLFRPGDPTKSWRVPIADETVTGYTSRTTYFLTAGGRREVGPTEETALSLFLELPSA